MSRTRIVGVCACDPSCLVHSSMTNSPVTVTFAPLTIAAESFSAIAPNILQFSQDVFSLSPNPDFAGRENEQMCLPFGVTRRTASFPTLPETVIVLIAIYAACFISLIRMPVTSLHFAWWSAKPLRRDHVVA